MKTYEEAIDWLRTCRALSPFPPDIRTPPPPYWPDDETEPVAEMTNLGRTEVKSIPDLRAYCLFLDKRGVPTLWQWTDIPEIIPITEEWLQKHTGPWRPGRWWFNHPPEAISRWCRQQRRKDTT